MWRRTPLRLRGVTGASGKKWRGRGGERKGGGVNLIKNKFPFSSTQSGFVFNCAVLIFPALLFLLALGPSLSFWEQSGGRGAAQEHNVIYSLPPPLSSPPPLPPPPSTFCSSNPLSVSSCCQGHTGSDFKAFSCNTMRFSHHESHKPCLCCRHTVLLMPVVMAGWMAG